MDLKSTDLVRDGLDMRRWRQRNSSWDKAGARRQLGVSDGEILILLLGSVYEIKGQLDLPGAVARISDEALQKARFLIVGDRQSPYSAALHEAVAELPPAL